MGKKMIGLLAAALLVLALVPVSRVQALPTRIRVAFNSNQAPYHFVDERGEAAGLHIDMLEHIAQRVGYELEYYPMETSTDCQNAIDRGEVDLVLNITTRLENAGWITESLSDEAICIVTKNSPDNLPAAERGDAVVQLATITPAISTQISPEKTYAVSSQRAVIEFLLSGKAETAVVLKESALYYLSGAESEEDYVISLNYVGTLAFALQVAENDYQLLQTMNREIARLRTSGAYSEMREKWNQNDAEEINMIRMRRIMLVLVAVIVVVGLYAVIVSNVRRALRDQVDKQTLALQKANQEIRQHMEQLEVESDMRNRIIRYSHLAMVLFAEDGRVMLVNDSAAALLKSWGEEAGERKNIGEMPVFSHIVGEHDARSLFCDQEGGAEGVQTIVLRRGEREYRYRYSLQRIFKAGKVWAVLLVVEDITDEEARRNARFEEEKTRTLNQVVAGIAHEIKKPLTSIKTFVEVLRGANSDPRFMEDFVCYVPAEVERINRLVESLISYAKPARGTMEALDLSEVVRETYFFAQTTNQNKNIFIVDEIETGHRIIGNRDQIKQILINIVINGMESMDKKLASLPEGTALPLTIALRSGERGSSIITIRDEGEGMSPEAIAQCMDPFFTTKRTGTGLGLTLSKQFARENNGELTITSQVGVYTEIQIEFGGRVNETENTDR